MNPSQWVTMIVSIGGAVLASLASWYSLKNTVQLNGQRLEQLEKNMDRHERMAEKLSSIDTRTQLTLQKVDNLENWILGRRVDKRKSQELTDDEKEP